MLPVRQVAKNWKRHKTVEWIKRVELLLAGWRDDVDDQFVPTSLSTLSQFLLLMIGLANCYDRRNSSRFNWEADPQSGRLRSLMISLANCTITAEISPYHWEIDKEEEARDVRGETNCSIGNGMISNWNFSVLWWSSLIFLSMENYWNNFEL